MNADWRGMTHMIIRCLMIAYLAVMACVWNISYAQVRNQVVFGITLEPNSLDPTLHRRPRLARWCTTTCSKVW